MRTFFFIMLVGFVVLGYHLLSNHETHKIEIVDHDEDRKKDEILKQFSFSTRHQAMDILDPLNKGRVANDPVLNKLLSSKKEFQTRKVSASIKINPAQSEGRKFLSPLKMGLNRQYFQARQEIQNEKTNFLINLGLNTTQLSTINQIESDNTREALQLVKEKQFSPQAITEKELSAQNKISQVMGPDAYAQYVVFMLQEAQKLKAIAAQNFSTANSRVSDATSARVQ